MKSTPARSCSSTTTPTLFDRELRGNFGTRYAITEVDSNGLTNTSRPIYGENKYTDILPSLNMSYEVAENMLLRFGAAKVMARPLLGNLAPSITAFSAPNAAGVTTGGSITIGNPKLEPFRAINLDLSLEWYFGQGSLISIAVFDKDVRSFPQTVVNSGTLSSILSQGHPGPDHRRHHHGHARPDRGRHAVRQHPGVRHPPVSRRAGRLHPRLRDRLSAEPDVPAVVPRQVRHPGQLHPPGVGAGLHHRSGPA
jgi:TonB-dependent receptor